jgi:DNA-binding beta-propeller fold protein YncE
MEIVMRVASMLLAVLACGGGDALVPSGTIELPKVEGRIDHLAYDAEHDRVFVCALGNGSVEVVDVKAGKVVKSLAKFDEPQGVAPVPANQEVAFTSGGDGKLHVLDAATLAEKKTLDAGEDADNVRLDAKAGRLWVGGGEGLVAFDVATWKRAALVKLAGHAESFQLESDGPRLFANVPAARHVAVVDRAKGEVVATWPLDGASSNFPMALDEKNGRLYVGCRSPAVVVVLDTKSGKVVAKSPIGGDCDDLFVDAGRGRVCVSCGEGVVSVLALEKDGAFAPVAKVETASGARTALFVAARNRMWVAAPARDGRAARLLAFDVRD